MFQLAMGLREASDFNVQIFINEPTMPHCLTDEASILDPDFAQIGTWESGWEIDPVERIVKYLFYRTHRYIRIAMQIIPMNTNRKNNLKNVDRNCHLVINL